MTSMPPSLTEYGKKILRSRNCGFSWIDIERVSGKLQDMISVTMTSQPFL
jgi:hypothetical protein